MRHLSTLAIDDMRFDDVVAFCQRQLRENVRLEYKEAFSSKDPGLQIAKEVAAFANTQGGLLILGVRETQSRVPEANPAGQDLGNDPHATVVNVCRAEIFPPVDAVVSDFLANPTDSTKGFVVARIPMSEDVPHTVERRTGIYVRIADQSGPVPATDDQIALLLGRRSAAVGQQQRRRDDAIRRMLLAASATSAPGDLYVTIGPLVNDDPLVPVTDLARRVQEWSLRSHFVDRTLPIDDRMNLRGVLDGVYTVSPKAPFGGLCDVYGNAAVMRRDLLEEAGVDPISAEEYESQLGNNSQNRNVKGIRAAAIAERVLCLVRYCQNMCESTGFVGSVSLRVELRHVFKTPLLSEAGHRGNYILGICPCDEHISLAMTFQSMELTGDHISLLEPLFLRLIWAWGCTDEKYVVRILDWGEQLIDGLEPCACREFNKPKGREHCFRCRSG